MPRNLTLADIKPLIGNLSRSNYYEVQFGGFSPGLIAYLSARDVDAQFISGDAGLLCANAELPGAGLAVIESSNFTGVTENFAHTRIFAPITLEFYCDSEYKILRFFEHWQEYITSGNGNNTSYATPYYNFRVKYPNDPATGYKSQSTRITKFESSFDRLMEYSFIGLFPSDITSTPVRYGPTNELTRVTVTFTYERFVAGSLYSFDFLQGNANNLRGIISNVSGLLNTASGIFNDIRTGNAGGLLSRFIN